MATSSLEQQDRTEPHNAPGAPAVQERPERRYERLERGEKFLVFGIMTVVAVEGFFAILGPGIRFSWLGVAWGVASFVFVLGLANYLYAGRPTAHAVASAWSAFQVVLSLVLLLMLAFNPGAIDFARHLTLPTLWMAAIKLVAYALLSVSLVLAPRVRDFLEVQRGAELEPENPLEPTGVVVTFSEDQKAVIASLSRLLKTAGVVLMVVGFLQALWSFFQFVAIANSGTTRVIEALGLWLVISFLPAVATFAIGILMFPPAGAARLIRVQGTDMSYIMNALIKLRAFFFAVVILTLLQVIGAVVALPLF